MAALIALPIFISEGLRLFGVTVFMMPRAGILAESLDAVFGTKIGSIRNTRGATPVGMTYINLPFMPFSLVVGVSLIPQRQMDAACEVELPLAAPGLMTGALLTFALSLGANTKTVILGGALCRLSPQ